MTEPKPRGDKRDYFISYNRADKGWAEWIGWVLEEAGFSVFLQAWDFRPGGNFVLDMQQAATRSGRTIAVLSPDFLTAQFPQSEWAARFREDPTGEKGFLIPVRVRDCQPEGLLGPITYIDLVDLEESDAEKALLEGLERRRAKPQARPSFPGRRARMVPVHPPYPGPVNVRLERPTIPIENWDAEADSWLAINEAISGAGFKSLTIKAAYVVGTVHDMCDAMAYFLSIPPANLPIVSPAYDTLSSAIELLGLCIAGSISSSSGENLRIGFRWLGSSATHEIDEQELLLQTSSAAYTIPRLMQLRQLAVQEQHLYGPNDASSSGTGLDDHELLTALRSKLAAGVDRWWNELQTSELLCNRLAQADVVGFQQRYVLRRTWLLFEKDATGTHHSITEILNRYH